MKQIQRIKIWIKIVHPALDRERLKQELDVRLRRKNTKIKKRTQKKLFDSFDYL